MTASRPFRQSIATLRHLARTNAVRVAALCGLFGAFLVVAVAYVREPAMLAASSGLAGGGEMSAAAGASPRAAGDPVAQFLRTRTGQLLFASNISDNCRRVLFDNRTGSTLEFGSVFCGPSSQNRRVEASALDRLQAVRRSFQKD